MPLILHIPVLQSGTLTVFCTGGELLPPTFACQSERSDYERISNYKRQQERLATLHLLHNILKIPAALGYAPNGAPLLSDGSFNISISHTENLIGVVLHPTTKIGLDMENSTRNFDAVAKRFLSQKEQETLSGQNLAYCLAWCAKEAIYKVASEGNFDFSKQIEIHPFELQQSGEFTATAISNGRRQAFTLSYRLVDGYAIVLAY
ncbi:MAG: 4'-phosphopantetheinyl transferase superfamily protein [Prevotellaceae bacterium]|jgi:phosphopantetheinyl transferase|nr:4'-phosphopantetheinyl transferase superfamily protein [Prevotellaceae bacterium]